MRIHVLPAGHGDCLLLEYGDPDDPSRVLIDGGTTGTFKRLRPLLEAIPEGRRHLELFVVTHVDADHIGGSLKLLEDTSLGITYGDIWFNGWEHLAPENRQTLGPAQGERLTDLLVERELPWNKAFEGGPVLVVPGEVPPSVPLPGGLQLTVLSPTQEQLTRMKGVWEDECRKAGLQPGIDEEDRAGADAPGAAGLTLGDDRPTIESLADTPFDPDTAPANGSSIGLLAEHDGLRVLLTGDAYSPVLEASIDALVRSRGGEVLNLDVCKLSHHGSAANTSVDLLRRLACERWIFSSNGAHFRHPDQAAVARVIAHGGSGAQLLFNYRTTFNDLWADPDMAGDFEFTATYAEGDEGLVVDLTS